jgi:phenylacetate-CoA ligase
MNRGVQFLYDHSPVALQNAMLTAYGFHLKRVRYGARHRELLGDLEQSQWLGAEAMAAFQRERLTGIVRHARLSTEFYANLPEMDAVDAVSLRSLPVVTKDMVQAAGVALIARQYHGQKLREIHTGGTTGKPLTIACVDETLQRNYAFFSRFQSWTGYRRGERVATFAGRNLVPPGQDDSGVYWRRNRAANTLLLSSYHISPRNLPGYARALSHFQPVLIDSYPSSLAPVAQYLLEQGDGSIRPRAIITSSETLDPEVRQLFERAFGCPVFDHYGAAEMAALITQCEKGTYHVNPEFGVVEILDEQGQPVAEGETGQMVATGFVNEVMPLIRYATGDLAVMGGQPCSCGRAFPSVERVIGRRDDVIVTPEGRRIGRLDPVFKVISGVFETQIVQTHRDRIRVDVVPAQGFRPEDADALKKELQRRVGQSMTVEVVQVAHIPRAKSGKLRTVVNLVDAARPAGEVR